MSDHANRRRLQAVGAYGGGPSATDRERRREPRSAKRGRSDVAARRPRCRGSFGYCRPAHGRSRTAAAPGPADRSRPRSRRCRARPWPSPASKCRCRSRSPAPAAPRGQTTRECPAAPRDAGPRRPAPQRTSPAIGPVVATGAPTSGAGCRKARNAASENSWPGDSAVRDGRRLRIRGSRPLPAAGRPRPPPACRDVSRPRVAHAFVHGGP